MRPESIRLAVTGSIPEALGRVCHGFGERSPLDSTEGKGPTKVVFRPFLRPGARFGRILGLSIADIRILRIEVRHRDPHGASGSIRQGIPNHAKNRL